MAVSPIEMQAHFEALGEPPLEVVMAGRDLVPAAMSRLVEGKVLAADDGSLFQQVTLLNLETGHVRRLINTSVSLNGDEVKSEEEDDRGLVIAGYVFDKIFIPQEYLKPLHLPRNRNKKLGFLRVSNVSPVALRLAAEEIRRARVTSDAMFDQFFRQMPYAYIKTGFIPPSASE